MKYQYSFLYETLNHIDNLIMILKKKLSNIKYGLRDPKTNKQWKKWNEEKHCFQATEEDYDRVWRLGTANETLTSKIGICWDTVEVERDFLSKTGIKFKMFYSEGPDYEDPTHTWIEYQDSNGKWKWLERSWEKYQDNDLESDDWLDLAKEITNILVKENDKHHKYKTYLLTTYPKPGVNSVEFMKSCRNQKKII
jgi:hypothetical protein